MAMADVQARKLDPNTRGVIRSRNAARFDKPENLKHGSIKLGSFKDDDQVPLENTVRSIANGLSVQLVEVYRNVDTSRKCTIAPIANGWKVTLEDPERTAANDPDTLVQIKSVPSINNTLPFRFMRIFAQYATARLCQGMGDFMVGEEAAGGRKTAWADIENGITAAYHGLHKRANTAVTDLTAELTSESGDPSVISNWVENLTRALRSPSSRIRRIRARKLAKNEKPTTPDRWAQLLKQVLMKDPPARSENANTGLTLHKTLVAALPASTLVNMAEIFANKAAAYVVNKNDWMRSDGHTIVINDTKYGPFKRVGTVNSTTRVTEPVSIARIETEPPQASADGSRLSLKYDVVDTLLSGFNVVIVQHGMQCPSEDSVGAVSEVVEALKNTTSPNVTVTLVAAVEECPGKQINTKATDTKTHNYDGKMVVHYKADGSKVLHGIQGTAAGTAIAPGDQHAGTYGALTDAVKAAMRFRSVSFKATTAGSVLLLRSVLYTVYDVNVGGLGVAPRLVVVSLGGAEPPELFQNPIAARPGDGPLANSATNANSASLLAKLEADYLKMAADEVVNYMKGASLKVDGLMTGRILDSLVGNTATRFVMLQHYVDANYVTEDHRKGLLRYLSSCASTVGLEGGGL